MRVALHRTELTLEDAYTHQAQLTVEGLAQAARLTLSSGSALPLLEAPFPPKALSASSRYPASRASAHTTAQFARSTSARPITASDTARVVVHGLAYPFEDRRIQPLPTKLRPRIRLQFVQVHLPLRQESNYPHRIINLLVSPKLLGLVSIRLWPGRDDRTNRL